MFRITAILCAAIYMTMLIGGRDHGQTRFGLIPQAAPVPRMALLPPTPEPDPAPETSAVVEEARFVPAAPVMTAPAVEVVTLAPETAVSVSDPVLAVAYVNSRSANLREGPGTDYAVVGRLTKGEAVQIVARDDDPQGWTLVRLEGDGEEGYIASRLLAE